MPILPFLSDSAVHALSKSSIVTTRCFSLARKAADVAARILDVAPAHCLPSCNNVKIDIRIQWTILRDHELPNVFARGQVGQAKLQYEPKAPEEGFVNSRLHIRYGNANAWEAFNILQEETDVHRIVARGRTGRTFGFVKDEDCVFIFGVVEDCLNVFALSTSSATWATNNGRPRSKPIASAAMVLLNA